MSDILETLQILCKILVTQFFITLRTFFEDRYAIYANKIIRSSFIADNLYKKTHNTQEQSVGIS